MNVNVNKLVLATVLAMLLLNACGGSTPSAPTPIPSANITASGNLSVTSCAGDLCTGFRFSVTNSGPGCAAATDLAGTITLSKADGTVSTANWALTLGEKTTGIFRVGETKTAVDDGGSLRDTPGSGTYSIKVTKQTNVKCQ